MRRLVLVLLIAAPLLCQEPRQMLRSRVDPEGPVMVGQPVRLTVDVLVTTWLTGAPEFPRLEIPGAVAVLPEERPANLTEQIEGQSWYGVSRSYLIYPQEARAYETPAAEVLVKFGGGPGSPARLPIPPRSFRATIPAEAASLGYFIPTTRFRMVQRLDPEASELKVGDSIRRTVEMTADGTFAMFLPPVDFGGAEGLAVYADAPVVEDLGGDREGFQGGRRIQSAAYVVETEGKYALPGFSVSWWDLNAGALREAAVPAIEFTAAPNPDYRPEIAVPVEAEEPVEEAPQRSLLDVVREWSVPVTAGLAAVLALAFLAPKAVRRIRERAHERRLRHATSEAAAFEELAKACGVNDRMATIRLLYVWLDRFQTGPGPATVERLLERANSPELTRRVDELFDGTPGWSGSGLIEHLRIARHALPSPERRAGGRALPKLNPV